MSTPGFKYDKRPPKRTDERIEINDKGDRLKKYKGKENSWPDQSTVQQSGQKHKKQQQEIKEKKKKIQAYFENDK